MIYGLKLNNGSVVELRFSMYFLKRVCEFSGYSLTTIYPYLIGDTSRIDRGELSGGIMDDINARSYVVAAGLEAAGFATGNPVSKDPVSKEVFDIIENTEGGYLSRQWAEITGKLMESLAAQLPKQELPKKKAAPKKRSVGLK